MNEATKDITAEPAGTPKPSRAKKNLSLAAKIAAGTIFALLIFQLGMFVGFRKASFSYRWGDAYAQAFGAPRGSFLGELASDLNGRDFVNGHGIDGIIVENDGSALVVRGPEGAEVMLRPDGGTVVVRGRLRAQIEEVMEGEKVTAIGAPNPDGTLTARLIRVFPAPHGETIMPRAPLFRFPLPGAPLFPHEPTNP